MTIRIAKREAPRSLTAALVVALLAACPGPDGGGGPPRAAWAQRQGQSARTLTLTLVATDNAVPARRTVAVITPEHHFAVLLIPPKASVTTNGTVRALSRIRAGQQLVCRGIWADAARTTFRAARVSVGPALSADALADRVAAACRQVTRQRGSSAPAQKTNPTTRPPGAGTESFVVEGLKFARVDDPAAAVSATSASAAVAAEERFPYQATGMLRNVSRQTFDRVEVQVGVFDNQGRKVADQTALVRNVRPGDRARFTADPPLLLPFLAGHTVRVDRLFVPPR